MRKNKLSKVLSLALMLVMLVSLASVGVTAGYHPNYPEHDIPLWAIFAPYENDPMDNARVNLGSLDPFQAIVINSSDFEQYIQPWATPENDHPFRDTTLELAGVKGGIDFEVNSEEEWEIYAEMINPMLHNMDSVEIPPFPVDGTNAEKAEWKAIYGNSFIMVNYLFHKHDLQGSQMYFDDNYHWQLCTECANRVYLANHTDKDNDGKCDFCGNAIRYYNVTVKDTTGGKVTLSANKGAMNGKIGVTVTPDAGYHLEKLNFVNANAMHSKRAVYEDTPNAEYHFFIANWDVEVEAIFVKD